ncbi:50S ribosomal protein L29 [Buchnera aphidicola]|uniref:50S ribosomal protein L29 n=1 Tax=Buchnera aphidicola TaxID=9 RepID=UPI0022389618|nr:50S ribosomal protein L29 [Buchnera aphidicola]MCW5197488.1 50S ribosomal protein L29 [Buchnera aphidicola (Chaitophorus viminalis)]
MKISELRNKKLDFLNTELLNLLKEKFNLKLQFSSNKLKQTHLLKINRKNIAIIKTVISEKDRLHVRKK